MLVVGSELNLKDLRLEAGSHIWLEQGCVIVKGTGLTSLPPLPGTRTFQFLSLPKKR